MTCAVLVTTTPPSSNLPSENLKNLAVDVGQGRSLPLASETKISESIDDQPGDHDKDEHKSSVPRKGAPIDDTEKLPVEEHTSRNISTDRASTTIVKDNENVTKSESSSSVKINDKSTASDKSTANASEKYSPYETKSTSANTSSSANSSESDSKSNSSATSKSSSTETSSSISSSLFKKPLVTYSVEDDPTLLNVPRVRQQIVPLTPTDVKAQSDDSAYLPPSSDFVLDRMESKGEIYIFPLVVLIFLVPMVLGVGIIILRRVRDYWSTRHYRRMDFLVDGISKVSNDEQLIRPSSNGCWKETPSLSVLQTQHYVMEAFETIFLQPNVRRYFSHSYNSLDAVVTKTNLSG
ncbi:hypothetical protein Bhyg_10974 [Pseudolycoriella hygida]|uniref:Uncharacterized protein n=1 Tax=Pseudolycoriella hygida TaxID=35572 RepID=A0A9Q0MUN0_9DIPT|nr:hypothetical protein Bhyg_10974 [Pseudolycoriella hygida]